MHVLKKAGGAVAVVAAAAVSVALAAPANADTGAQAGDVVIVGSDTVQNAINFVLDGSPGVAGGYNTAGNLNRAVSFDATGDANGRAVYDGNCGANLPTTGIPDLCANVGSIPGARSVTDGVTTATSKTVTSATAAFTFQDVGAAITSTSGDIPVGDTIASVQSATSITLAAAATVSGTGVQLTITPSRAANLIPGSIVLRAGTKPVTRPNGSGAGVAALTSDSLAGFHGLPTGSIQIARMSRLPNSGEETNCPTTNACGGLHVYKIATDGFTMVHSNGLRTVTDGVTNSTTTITSATANFASLDVGATVTGAGIPAADTIASVTNATTAVLTTAATATATGVSLTIQRAGGTTQNYNGPASLSAQQLLAIYTCAATTWNAVAGNSGGSTDTIHPLIPQGGSGTRTAFLDDLASLNGLSSDPTPGPCVRTVEEHDPTGIYADPTPGDAIEPFSLGKLALINGGYFAQGVGYSTTSFPNGAYSPTYLNTTATGTALDTHPDWTTTRNLYITIRNPDLAISTPFQPGSTQNWSVALITNAFSAIKSSGGQAEIAAAGFTYSFSDCGINPTTC